MTHTITQAPRWALDAAHDAIGFAHGDHPSSPPRSLVADCCRDAAADAAWDLHAASGGWHDQPPMTNAQAMALAKAWADDLVRRVSGLWGA